MQNNSGGYHKDEFVEEDLDDLVMLTIGIPVSHLARLEEMAEDEGESLDWAINEAIELSIYRQGLSRGVWVEIRY